MVTGDARMLMVYDILRTSCRPPTISEPSRYRDKTPQPGREYSRGNAFFSSDDDLSIYILYNPLAGKIIALALE